MKPDHPKSVLRRLRKAANELFYGFSGYELELESRKERGHLQDLFFLMICGDLVGLPVMPPYYSLRLLPYIIPLTEKWKRRMLREKDLTDMVGEL